jgi:hypothetical protein
MSSRYDQREWARLERLRAIGFTPTGTNGEAATLDGEFTVEELRAATAPLGEG